MQQRSSLKLPPSYTRKQMGDACEMLVAAELTLAGIPALKVPDKLARLRCDRAAA